MKVMIVTPYFYPKIGGVEKHSYNIAKGLAREGHEILVVTSENPESGHVDFQSDHIRVIRLRVLFTLSNSPFNPSWLFQLRRLIKTEKPDIIHAHSPVPGMADIAFFARRGTKFIIKYHSGSLVKGSLALDLLLRIYEQTVLKHIFLNADGVSAVYPEFVNKLVKSKRAVTFIPPGVDIKAFESTNTESKKWDLLYVGRIDKSSRWKGIETLLEAVSIIKIKLPRVQLNLVGSGDDIEFMKHIGADLEIEENVTFSGALHGKELARAYHQSKMLVLPSHTEAESFGNVLIEAMACGLPVIGSNVGGIPNAIKNNYNGYLVTPKDAKSIAEKAEYLLANPNRAIEIGKAGRSYVKAYFTTEALINKTSELLTDTMSQS